MKCPFCGDDDSKVTDKREISAGGGIRRRRECLKCSRRFTTHEVLADLRVSVIKKDGRREEFDVEKLRVGILKALEKRPSIDKTQSLVDKIEGRIRIKGYREIPSEVLGKWILSELKRIDGVAYLRFASVYHDFGDPKDFVKEVNILAD